MHKQQLLTYIKHPHKLTTAAIPILQEVANQYPYFQAVHLLMAKATYATAPQDASAEVQKAAIYATNRSHLKALLESTPPFNPPVTPRIEAPKPPVEAAPTTTENHFINGYISKLSQQDAQSITKKKVLEQLDLIQAFIQKNINFKPQSYAFDPQDTRAQIDLASNNVTLHDELLTENLAKVLFQQGKVQQAMEVYKKLGLKYPEKRTYFATLMQELNTQT